MRRAIAKLPLRYQYTLHNIVGHPLMGLLRLVGADELAEAAHWHTMPHKELSTEEANRKGHRGREAQEWQRKLDAKKPTTVEWADIRDNPNPFDFARKR